MLRVAAVAVVLTVTLQALAAAGCELVCNGVVPPSGFSGPAATASKCHDAGSLQHEGALAASTTGCQHVLGDPVTTTDGLYTNAHGNVRHALPPRAVGVARDGSNPTSLQMPTSPPGRPAGVTSPLRL